MAYIRVDKTNTTPGYRFIVTRDELEKLEKYRRAGPAKTITELENRIGRRFTREEVDQAAINYIPSVPEPKIPKSGRGPIVMGNRQPIKSLRAAARHSMIPTS